MEIVRIGICYSDPLDPDEVHAVGIRLETLQLCILARQGVVRLSDYVSQHPDRVEAVKQAIRDRLR